MSSIFNTVIMAGGVGSRLWPLSRSSYPKQFHRLIEDENSLTMLQQSFSRLSGIKSDTTQVICNEEHRFLAAEQCRAMVNKADLIIEPVGRNTAPAVITAALRLVKANRDEPMLILSADHAIIDEKLFCDKLMQAHLLAEFDKLVILGVQPSFACTGYGYIKLGQSDGAGFKVDEFVEKPNEIVAESYFCDGGYLWNSGMFIVRPSVLLEEAFVHCPRLLSQCKLVSALEEKDLDFIRLPMKEFSMCENISLDFAIMEKTERSTVVPLDCDWSDIGDFQALWRSSARNEQGNVIKGDVVTIDTFNSLVMAENKLVTILGLEGIAVVETKDAVLVTALSEVQKVKDVVTALKGRGELNYHTKVHRPWGSYDSLEHDTTYQVKRIEVNPGARLSVQRHKYRSEHWVVVSGLATVYLDGEESELYPNESIYIPVGAIHSLENKTNEILCLIEVQSGTYLGEDDIERFDDVYGRC